MASQLDQSRHWCHQLTRRTAGNFYYSFLTLPRQLRLDMCVLYAFMRITDDLGDDESVELPQRRQRLQSWKAQTDSVLRGASASDHCLQAIADLVTRHAIPHEHLLAVIDGVAFDLDPRPIETFSDLETYCYHVAGAVGLCCIHIWGFEGPTAIERAIDCGLAFQMTNILRDLAEDAARGRLYLPASELRRFDYSFEDLRLHRCDERFEELMQFQLQRTAGLYERAWELRGQLSAAGIPVYTAMLRIYGGLFNRIRTHWADVFDQRISLSMPRKVWIAAETLVTRGRFASPPVKRSKTRLM